MAEGTPLNIMVVGIYRSGSSAVVDYLRGHPDCAVPPGEFTDFKRYYRIGSMLEAPSIARARWFARRLGLGVALGSLPLAYFWQLGGADQSRLPVKKRVRHHRLKLHYLRQYLTRLRRGEAGAADTELWNQWMRAVGAAHAGDKAAVVWNQPIWIGQHDGCWPEVFAPFKLVVVHRDPYDQFAEVLRQGTLGKRRSDPMYDDSIKDGIAYLLSGIAGKMEGIIALKRQLPEDALLTVRFEDFVRQHEAEAARLSNFLGLPQQQIANAPFDPSKSIKNIGIGQSEAIREMLAPYDELLTRLNSLREQI